MLGQREQFFPSHRHGLAELPGRLAEPPDRYRAEFRASSAVCIVHFSYLEGPGTIGGIRLSRFSANSSLHAPDTLLYGWGPKSERPIPT